MAKRIYSDLEIRGEEVWSCGHRAGSVCADCHVELVHTLNDLLGEVEYLTKEIELLRSYPRRRYKRGRRKLDIRSQVILASRAKTNEIPSINPEPEPATPILHEPEKDHGRYYRTRCIRCRKMYDHYLNASRLVFCSAECEAACRYEHENKIEVQCRVCKELFIKRTIHHVVCSKGCRRIENQIIYGAEPK